MSSVPYGPLRVNRSSRQLDGLVAWFPWIGGHFTNPLFNSVGGGTNPGDFRMTQFGKAIYQGVGTSTLVNQEHPVGINFTDGFTFVFTIENIDWTTTALQAGIVSADPPSGNSFSGVRIDTFNATHPIEMFTRDESYTYHNLHYVAGDNEPGTLDQWAFNIKISGADVISNSYRRGVFDRTVTDTWTPFSGSLTKFSGNGGNTALESHVFDQRIYNRVLTVAEMEALWAPETRWELYAGQPEFSYKSAAFAGPYSSPLPAFRTVRA